jgi:mono/diheme cytochrome c family protein
MMTPHPLKYAAVFAFGAILGGCVSTEQLAPPVSPRMAAAGGASTAALESGRRIYTGRCAACHSIDPVAKHSPDRWRAIIDDMADEAELSAAEKSAVLAYVLAARSVATMGATP